MAFIAMISAPEHDPTAEAVFNLSRKVIEPTLDQLTQEEEKAFFDKAQAWLT